jgi:hypothetical protein
LFKYQGIENKFLKLYERFINLDFEYEKFVNNHMMIQCLAKEYNIKNLFFLKLGKYGPEPLNLIPFYKNNYFKFFNIFDKEDHCLPNDNGHFSSFGHQYLANLMYKELKK